MAMDLSGGGAAQAPAATASPEAPKYELDGRIPKALRDLMEASGVGEWDVEEIVANEGYVTRGTKIWEFNQQNPGIVEGLLVPSWDQVLKKIRLMWEKEEIPFN